MSTSNKETRKAPAVRGGPAFKARWWWLVALSLPALVIAVMIRSYGVDIPYWDQWNGFCPLLEKRHLGTLELADFWAFHNEHRILFPRLIMYGLALMTGWNIKAELVVNWLLAISCALSVWRLARVTGWKQPGTGLWLLLGANLLLFSPREYENWLWGFQNQFLLPPACTLACLWIVSSVRPPVNFLLAMVLCIISTFSLASGFTAWIITAPLLLLPEGRFSLHGRKGWLAAWLIGFVCVTGLYFHGFHRPPQHPGLGEALTHWPNTLRYFLTYLGGPFAHGTSMNAVAVAQTVGLALLVILAAAFGYLWRWRRDAAFVAQSLPWFVTTWIALFNAGLTSMGRQEFGVNQALD